jgi:hypothetical protein
MIVSDRLDCRQIAARLENLFRRQENNTRSGFRDSQTGALLIHSIPQMIFTGQSFTICIQVFTPTSSFLNITQNIWTHEIQNLHSQFSTVIVNRCWIQFHQSRRGILLVKCLTICSRKPVCCYSLRQPYFLIYDPRRSYRRHGPASLTRPAD